MKKILLLVMLSLSMFVVPVHAFKHFYTNQLGFGSTIIHVKGNKTDVKDFCDVTDKTIKYRNAKVITDSVGDRAIVPTGKILKVKLSSESRYFAWGEKLNLE